MRPVTMSVVSMAAVAVSAGACVPWLEISDDGRASVSAVGPAGSGGSEKSASGVVRRGAGSVPFGTEPDLQVDLRRQIGGLAIADMNGDGFSDLVAVCYISNSFPPYEDWREMIFYGSASGLSTTPGWLSDNQTHAGDVQVGDINGDLFPDLVVVRGGGVRADAVQVYFGGPGGPATSPGYSSNIPGRAWGTAGDLFDIDDDGDLDLVTTNQGLSPDAFRPAMLFRNDGSGLSIAPAWTSGAAEISNGVTHADLVGDDGLPELIVAKWVNFQSGVYENIAGTPAAFPFEAVPTAGTDRGVAVGDVTGDGIAEVLVGGDPARLYERVNGAMVPIWSANPPNSGTQDIRLHDFDRDGDLDVADVVFSSGRVYLYQNTGGVLDTEPTWTFDAPEVGTALVFGDVNSDGLDDLVIGYAGNTCIRVFFGQPGACVADLAPPAGVLDLADIQAFVGAFTTGEALADLVAPFGVFDLADVQAFVSSFVAGCP